MLPKAELHVHIESTTLPSKAKELAERHHMKLPEDIFGPNDTYAWKDFPDFLRAYDVVADVIKTSQDYYEIIRDYLIRSSKEGLIYTELTISPYHFDKQGINYGEVVAAMVEGIDEARKETGIEGRLLVVGVRHFGLDSVMHAAELLINHPHPYTVGFGLAGDEADYPAKDFAKPFEIVREAGYGCTAHAGEVAGPESIYQALDDLKVNRIGHGVRCVEDAVLMKRLADSNIALEICPSSNLCLKVFSSVEAYPLRKIYDAGIPVTLNSDDPYFFNTTIGKEYDIARAHFGFSDEELIGITKTAIEHSFADQETKDRLLAKLKNI